MGGSRMPGIVVPGGRGDRDRRCGSRHSIATGPLPGPVGVPRENFASFAAAMATTPGFVAGANCSTTCATTSASTTTARSPGRLLPADDRLGPCILAMATGGVSGSASRLPSDPPVSRRPLSSAQPPTVIAPTPSGAPPLRRPPAVAIVLPIAAALLAYAGSLGGGFVFDDYKVFVDRPLLVKGDWWEAAFGTWHMPLANRPLVCATFALQPTFGLPLATAYRIGNLALHIVCALLVLGVV
ncbi:MAG: hypothetical protein JNM25_15950, partial [Planctomycetes bacterium]|nr:hypothetical protein [Planctomycetota bacterium]